ncbi:MAG: hypothetical protein JWP87_3136 [Labilithrix sp.]|nr:hypothetical protein [Labilithrix sp.]
MRRYLPRLLLSIAALTSTAATASAAEPSVGEPHSAETRAKLVDMGPNRLLLATGAATFAFAYGGSLWVGATSTRSSDRPLLVPFAGPWLAFARRGSCDADGGSRPCGPETTYAALLVADGLVQAAGVVQIALAFLHRDMRSAKEPLVNTARLSIAPARTTNGGLGIAAAGAF